MTYNHATLHPAMTAIAAAIALSSAPLLAQTADPTVATTPAIGTPAPSAAEPVAADPVAADPVAIKTTVTTSHKATAPQTAAHSTHETKTETKTVTKTTRPVAPAPTATALAPAAQIPVAEPLPVQPEIAATPLAPPADQPPVNAQATSSNMLPIAGAVGLGILLLAGAGIAASRRRRRADQLDEREVAYADTQPQAVAEPAMADMQRAIAEPEFVAAPTAMAPMDPDAETDADLTPVEGPTTDVPEGFDVSQFGPNVRAAYGGPTVDNASLSLRHRLRKANAMDQMERSAAEDEAEVPAAAPAATEQSNEDFGLPGAKKPPTRPAFIN